MRRGAIVGLVLLAALVLIVGVFVSAYNQLVRLDQAVDSQWAQVQNAYQRRNDLVPNLVETVKGAANFEQQTFTQVAEARSRASQIAAQPPPNVTEDPQALQRYQEAQDRLGGALGRLLVVVERYPELHATQAFRDLQAQLEGTENRIAVERMRFNEAAREYNTKRNTFPTALVVRFFGGRFKEKAYFQAQAGAQTPPPVKFQ